MPGLNTTTIGLRGSMGIKTRSGAKAYNQKQMLSHYAGCFSKPKSTPTKNDSIASRLRARR